MSKYKISVIIPIYNVEKYIEETIKSIINQSIGFGNIELILINDGSPYNEEEICLKYKKKYDNFAWTVALAPAEDPQIAVAVMLVQGKSSSNAAPVVREIIGKYGDKSGWEKLF